MSGRRTGFALLTALMASAAPPPEDDRFAISQVRVQVPALTVFVDVRSPALVERKGISASVGSEAAEVESLRVFEGPVAYVLLAGVPRSAAEREFATARAALASFAEGLGAKDQLAIVRFGDTVEAALDFTADRAAWAAAIERLQPAGQQMRLHAALVRGLELGARADAALPMRRAVVVMTDGRDEGSGLSIDDVIAQTRAMVAPVYAVGIGGGEYTGIERAAISSGGRFLTADSVAHALDRVREAVTNVLEARLVCPRCVADGRAANLKLSWKPGDQEWTASADVRLTPGVPAGAANAKPAEARRWWPWLIVLILPCALLAARRRRRTGDLPAPMPAAAALATMPGEPAPTFTPPPPAVACRVRFTVVRGDDPGRHYDLALADRATVGTGPSARLRLAAERTVSERHFELFPRDGRVWLRDLGSTQGTLLNGVPVTHDQPLADGDFITAGQTQLRITLAEARR